MLAGISDGAGALGAVGEVGLNRGSACAALANVGSKGLGLVGLAAVVEDHGKTLAGEAAGDGGADAGRGAGDESDLIWVRCHESMWKISGRAQGFNSDRRWQGG